MKDRDVPISSTDELTVAGGRLADRVRTLGEYKPTNMPLSAAEIEHRKRLEQSHPGFAWTPRTTGTMAEIEPIPEEELAGV